MMLYFKFLDVRFFVLKNLSSLLGSLPVGIGEVDFSESDIFGSDFYIFIGADVSKRIFQSKRNNRFESHRFIISAFSYICLLFVFGKVDHHITRLCAFSNDHSFVHRSLRKNEDFSTFLQFPDTVFHTFSTFHTDHRTVGSLWDIALVRRVMREGTIHNSFTFGHEYKCPSKSKQTSRRYFKFQSRDTVDGKHIGHLSFFACYHIYDRPRQFLVDIDDYTFDRFCFVSSFFFENYLRSRHLNFKSFSSHRFDED